MIRDGERAGRPDADRAPLRARALLPAEAIVAEDDRDSGRNRCRDARMGLFGFAIPEEYGGIGLTHGRGGAGRFRARAALRRSDLIADQQRHRLEGHRGRRYGRAEAEVPAALASGEIIGSFALTEPGSGSDAGALATSARLEGDHYVLNGTKRYITNAPEAGVFTVMARTDPNTRDAAGVSAFLVEAGTPGLSLGPIDRKMGQRGGHTCDVIFQDAAFPPAHHRRPGRQGFKTAMKVLDKARLNIAAVCVGVAERMLDDALRYAMQRRQFGRPVAEFQLVQAMLADCRTDIFAARSMTLEAARKHDAGERVALEASCCKILRVRDVRPGGRSRRADPRRRRLHGRLRHRAVLSRRAAVSHLRRHRQIQQLVIARELLNA